MATSWADDDEETFPDAAGKVLASSKNTQHDNGKGNYDNGGERGGTYDGGRGYDRGDRGGGGGGHDRDDRGGAGYGGGRSSGYSGGGGGRDHEQVPIPDDPPYKVCTNRNGTALAANGMSFMCVKLFERLGVVLLLWDRSSAPNIIVFEIFFSTHGVIRVYRWSHHVAISLHADETTPFTAGCCMSFVTLSSKQRLSVSTFQPMHSHEQCSPVTIGSGLDVREAWNGRRGQRTTRCVSGVGSYS